MITDEQVESIVATIAPLQEQVLRKAIRALLEAFHDDRALRAEAEKLPQSHVMVPEFTQREWRILGMACWRFMNHAYQNANAAAQVGVIGPYKDGDAAKFLKDAKDTEALIGKIRAAQEGEIVSTKCPKCGNYSIGCGYGLAGGGIGVYFYCETDGCDYFDKTPDPELSTPEEMESHRAAQEGKS